jgi:Transcription elongation factor, GreA/GreB, C-term
MADDLMISPQSDSEEGGKVVTLGTHVELRLVCTSVVESISLDIVQDRLSDFDHGLLSVEAPLAKAILNHPENDTIPYQMGDIRAVYIEKISPGKSLPDSENAVTRENIIPNALAESERTNAMIFASSFSGKWGDYDPSNIKEDW